MTNFFDLLNEVVFWFYENVWMTFFELIYNNENDYFRYTMYLLVFVGIAGFLSEVLISFIFSFRLRKVIIFSPFKLKDYNAQYQDIYPNKKLTSRIVRQRFNSRDLSVLADKKFSVVQDKKLSVVQDKKLFIPIKGIVHPIPYNVLSPKERKLYKLRYFYFPEFRLYSSLISRSFDSEVARSLHSIQEKDINEKYDDSKRFNSRDLSVLADKKFSVVQDKKLSVVQDKKLFIPIKGIVHPIPYNVLSPKERKLYKSRSFDSEVARSLHSIQEKDINEKYDDSKRFNGLDSRITPRYSDMIILTVRHPVLMARAYSSFNSLKSYYRNYYNSLESNLTDGFNGSFNNFSRAMLFKFVDSYDMNDIKFARGSSSNDENISDNESSYDLDSWKEHSINHRPVYKRKEQ